MEDEKQLMIIEERSDTTNDNSANESGIAVEKENIKGNENAVEFKEEFGISNKEINKEGVLRSQSINITENASKNSTSLERVKSNISRTSTRNSLPPPERRKSFQVRAMFRKTLSFQKRQLGTNICCVGVCPTMMIIIAFLLSLLIEYLLRDIIKTEKYEYCSNEYNGKLYLPNTGSQEKQGNPDVRVCHYNPNGDSCSYWFGSNDHFESFPYDTVPQNNEANINRDTLFIPSVDIEGKNGNYLYIANIIQKQLSEMMKGYNALKDITKQIKIFNNKNNSKSKRAFDISQYANRDSLILKYITDNIIRPWGFIAVNKHNVTEKTLIGERKEGPKGITFQTINSDQYTLSNKGYLDYTYSRYMLDIGSLSKGVLSFERVPYFEVLEVDDDNDVDDLLTKRIKLVNKILSNSSFDSYTEEEKQQIDLSVFDNTEDAIKKSVNYMPYGVVYFKDVNEEKLNYNLVIAVGENRKLASLYSCEVCGDVTPYMSFPGRGKRLAYFLTETSNAIVKKITDNKVSITQGFRSFPENIESGLPIDLPSMIGIALFPWGVSFLIPIFVIGLVKEKEERFLVMMNMNGMKSSTYYISVYITNLCLSMLSMACFIIAGMICNMNMFIKTSIVVLIIVFFIWANIQVAMAFVLSFFFSRNGTALIASFLIVLLSIVFSLGLIEIFETTNFYFIWPPFAFYYILSILSTLSVSKINPAYQLFNFVPGNKVFTATMFLIFDFFIFMLLSLYFDAVIPQEFGNHLPWHLNIVSRIKKLFNGKDKIVIENADEANKNPFYTEEEERAAKTLEDDDVRAERNRVISGKYDHNSPLIIKNARKEYAPRVKGGKPHVAVHSVTFAVEEGIVFGLLGPNGAGKTTLIHSLIGVYTLTNGYAKLAGFNVKTDMDQVYKRIGICPQHDILWNDLTVEEHLLFYARLKGIPQDQEEASIVESMSSVGLESFRDSKVKGLSGGEKRRLSIAIALVGDPKLVFLDEPTTGLDPDVRRLIWGILNEISQNRTIIITTHSMEEAEVLCHRIGIMSHGTLRCCATQLRLKELYGSGFKLSYSNQPEKYKELKEFIINLLPSEYKAVRDLTSTSIYEFIPTKGLISKLFEELENNKEKYGITDWGISQSSLEEVFLSIISDDDADAS